MHIDNLLAITSITHAVRNFGARVGACVRATPDTFNVELGSYKARARLCFAVRSPGRTQICRLA
jgi:hypothetical protein